LCALLLASSACTYGTVQDASTFAYLGGALVEFQVPDTVTPPMQIPGFPDSRFLFQPAIFEERPLLGAPTWSATDFFSGGAHGLYYLNEYAPVFNREPGKSFYVPSGWIRARVRKAGYDDRVFYRNHLYQECQFSSLQGGASGSSVFVHPLTPPLLTNVAGSPPRCAEQSFLLHSSGDNYVRTPDLIVDPRGLRDRIFARCDDGISSCLRVTVATVNVGNGHLIIRGDWNGTTAANVRQERYRRNSTGITNGIVQDLLPDAKFEFHPAPQHNHIHLLEWAQMRLRRITPACSTERLAENCPVVSTALSPPKVGFCLQSTSVYDKTMERMPNHEAFVGQTCDVQAGSTQLFQGIKAGWEDVYEKVLPGQQIPLQGLVVGEYWLEVEVNPPNAQGQRLVIESDYANNISRLRIPILDF
jgi:hypothetical protein